MSAEPDLANVERLTAALRQLGHPADLPPWGRASAECDHMGAKLADAVLQAGLNYEGVVRGRVLRIRDEYPGAATTRGFLALLRDLGPEAVLGVSRGRKLRTTREVTEFFASQEVDTPDELRDWLQAPGHTALLDQVYGVGAKTISFLKLLVGLDAIAVDIHINRFVATAGVSARDPERIELLLKHAGERLGLHCEQVDALIWRHMATQASLRRRGLAT